GPAKAVHVQQPPPHVPVETARPRPIPKTTVPASATPEIVPAPTAPSPARDRPVSKRLVSREQEVASSMLSSTPAPVAVNAALRPRSAPRGPTEAAKPAE